MKLILLFLLINHFIGEFYTSRDEKQKDYDIKKLMVHGLTYAIPFVVSMFVFSFERHAVQVFGMVIIIHFLLELGKNFTLNIFKTTTRLQSKVYIVNQLVHLGILVYTAYFYRLYAKYFIPFELLQNILLNLEIDFTLFCKWCLALIMVGIPSNLTFNRIFNSLKPIETNPVILDDTQKKEIEDFRDSMKYGEVIGVLEKVLILILLSTGEYLTIGLVLTAKSIARYDKISKSKSFAEFYLIGTLASILTVVVIHKLVFNIL